MPREGIQGKGGKNNRRQELRMLASSACSTPHSPCHSNKSLPLSDLLVLCETIKFSATQLHQHLPTSLIHWPPSSSRRSQHHATTPFPTFPAAPDSDSDVGPKSWWPVGGGLERRFQGVLLSSEHLAPSL